MSEIAIEVTGLSKRYRLLGRRPFYGTLRDTLVEGVTKSAQALFSRSGGSKRGSTGNDDYIWSLRDVSFEVKRGEVVGLVGRNGAGKSTLLKILSRVTEPTCGYAEIRGRIGSLLEVGTGFHEELTGRENVSLNGAILGMKKADIARQFDAIVAFAGLDKFVDTPVKYYSSGMYMRLGFSIAFHLAPEVLLVDEVLAVGDVGFQEKCLAKMKEMAADGRTIMFVSHNLALVKALCHTTVVLNDGIVDFRGSAVDGVARYVNSFTAQEPRDGSTQRGTRWHHVTVNGHSAVDVISALPGEPFEVGGLLECQGEFLSGRFECQILNASREVVVCQTIAQQTLLARTLDAGSYAVTVDFPPLWLSPGIYTIVMKFAGDSSQSMKTREFASGPVLVNIPGDPTSAHSATLAPPARWSVARNVSSKVSATDRWPAATLSSAQP